MTLEQQIKDSDAAFVEAFNRGDANSLATLHADGATLLAPDVPATEGGSQAVVEGFRELLDAGWKNMTLDTVKIDSDGDLAYHYGRVGADVPNQAGSMERVTGKYVDIYRRGGDGMWKIQLTIYNMDAPMP